MLEVCFSDALKGGLKFARLKGKSAFLNDQQDLLMPCYGLSFGNVNDVMDIELGRTLCRNQDEIQFCLDVYEQCRQDQSFLALGKPMSKHYLAHLAECWDRSNWALEMM